MTIRGFVAVSKREGNKIPKIIPWGEDSANQIIM